jgi:D-3-phosphoglycerate dehydrogenase
MGVTSIGILEPADFSPEAIKELNEIGQVKKYNSSLDLGDFLNDVEILFVRLGFYLDADLLNKAPKLKVICSPTTGFNHLDMAEVNKRNIAYLSLKGHTGFLADIRATPEHTLGLILAIIKNYKQAFISDKNDHWNRDACKGFEVFDSTIGIIGLGRVGKILCKYLNVLGGTVMHYDIEKIDFPGSTQVNTIGELINSSDIVVLCANYDPEKNVIIGEEEILGMQGKFFVNTARGELVDEPLLIEYIRKGHFAGVALDVIQDEKDPKAKNKFLPLINEHNVILTPHIAGATYKSMERTEEFITQKLKEYLDVQG